MPWRARKMDKWRMQKRNTSGICQCTRMTMVPPELPSGLPPCSQPVDKPAPQATDRALAKSRSKATGECRRSFLNTTGVMRISRTTRNRSSASRRCTPTLISMQGGAVSDSISAAGCLPGIAAIFSTRKWAAATIREFPMHMPIWRMRKQAGVDDLVVSPGIPVAYSVDSTA